MKLNMLIFNQVLRQVKLEPIKLAYEEKNEKQVKQHSITEDLNYLKRELWVSQNSNRFELNDIGDQEA